MSTGSDRPDGPAAADGLVNAESPTASASRDLAQNAADADVAASDSDQTASDSDQTASDSDQTWSDVDQTASDEEQAASDQESAQGSDQRVRDLGAGHREHARQVRGDQARSRLRTGVSRDITADERAQAATMREQVAVARDVTTQPKTEPAQAEQAEPPRVVGHAERTIRAARSRRQAADDRARAAADRSRAADDRARAAEERAESAHERTLAARDRAQAALDREASETDELTHVRRRGPGMKQLQREVDRAHRVPEDLVVTFVDVDGLKRVNDTQGHLAGDALLVAVADSLKECLRSYDLIMRFGGDEFVCALPNVDVEGVRKRFEHVSKTLASSPSKASITVGFAELGGEDSAEEIIRRADQDLLAHRERS